MLLKQIHISFHNSSFSDNFFTNCTNAIKDRVKVTVMGASLDELDSMLQCHDIRTSVVFGSDVSLEGKLMFYQFVLFSIIHFMILDCFSRCFAFPMNTEDEY